MHKLACWTVGFVLLESMGLRAAHLTGKWRAEFDTQIGKQKYLYELKAEADKITGQATGEVGGDKHTVELKEGKLSGDVVSFVEQFDYQGNAIAITYSGKLTGDELARYEAVVAEFLTPECAAWLAGQSPPSN